MPRTLTLHIGTPKSGTTYLQALLRSGRADLAARGILYPGEHTLPQGGLNHQPAIYAVAGTGSIHWNTPEVRANGEKYLTRLRPEIDAHDGRVLFSAESLTYVEPDEARALLQRLGVPAEDTTVVITARDLGRLLTSVWQQNVKNGQTGPMEDYLDEVGGQRGTTAAFWRGLGLPGIVERWSQVVPASRIRLVTSPQDRSDPDALWKRFCTACDLPQVPSSRYGTQSGVDNNRSLTVSQTEMLRHVNVLLDAEDLTRSERQRIRARLLDAWMNHGSGGRPLRLLAHRFATVAAWAEEDEKALLAAGVEVVGDLADLRPKPSKATATEPATTEEFARDLLDLTRTALAPQPTRPQAVRAAVGDLPAVVRTPGGTRTLQARLRTLGGELGSEVVQRARTSQVPRKAARAVRDVAGRATSRGTGGR